MVRQLFAKQIEGAVIVVVTALIGYLLLYISIFWRFEDTRLSYGDVSSGPLIAEISGTSANDGIYYLPNDARVKTLLNAAHHSTNFFTPETLEVPLSSGKKVVIDARGILTIGEMDNATKLACDIPIDINRANVKDLMLLPGVGEKTAWRIILERNKMGGFKKIEDIMKVKGIKEKKFQKIRKYVTVTHS